MDHEAGLKPLDSFPIIRSRDVEEVREAVIDSYGALRLDLPRHAEGFDVRANQWQSQSVGLSYCGYGTPVELTFPAASFFRQQICLSGNSGLKVGRVEKQVTSEESYVVPPETPIEVAFAQGYEQLVLRIEGDALFSKLAALIGSTPSRKLVFNGMNGFNGAGINNIRRLLTFFASELDSSSNLLSPTIVELEQALIVSFLCNNPHNYSAFLESRSRPPASWQVRRAEEYVEAHWNRPITIEDLARETSSSARSLFRQFRKSRGQSPMAFLKDVRLRHARDILQRSGLSPSVTETAIACGFGNLGHFATDYFKRFGERPSDTVKRNKSVSAQAAGGSDEQPYY
jgi:AraC-like DNA-binding protein